MPDILPDVREIKPWFVGFMRGLLLAVLSLAVTSGIDLMTTTDVPNSLQFWAPFILLALRSAEGALDSLKRGDAAGPIKGSGTIRLNQ